MFQITIDVATTRSRAETRTGIKHLEPLDIAAVPPAFVDDELGKHAPAAIGDAFGQMVIADHPGDVQGFQADVAKGIHDLARLFVQEVPALVSYLLVLPGQGKSGLLPVPAALLAATQTALQPLELFLCLAQVGGVFNYCPTIGQRLAQGGKAPEANINPHRLSANLWFRSFHLALNGNEILAGLGFRHTAIFHFAFHRSVKHCSHLTYFGQVNPAVRHLEPLGVGDGLLVVLAVIVGKAFRHPVLTRFTVSVGQSPLAFHPEKVPVSPIELVERTLKHLRIALVQPGVRLSLLQLFQHHLHISFVQREAMLKPGILFEGQEMVVDKAGLSKLDGQLALLRFSGVDPKAVADPGQVTATTGDCPGQEPLREAFGKDLGSAAGAHTLDPALGGQANNLQVSELLTNDNHFAALWWFVVVPNNCSDYKTADSRMQIGHVGLLARLSEDNHKRKHKKLFYPRTEVLGFTGSSLISASIVRSHSPVSLNRRPGSKSGTSREKESKEDQPVFLLSLPRSKPAWLGRGRVYLVSGLVALFLWVGMLGDLSG